MNTPIDLSFTTKTGRMSIENYLAKNYPDFLFFLKNKYLDSNSINEKLYRYYNNIDKIPTCPVCGNNTRFISYSKGYAAHCSYKCTQNDNTVRKKLDTSNKEKYGENCYKLFNIKGKQTKKEKYNDENYNNSEKAKQTFLERYGVDNPMKNEEFLEQSKKTCLEKYGSEYYISSKEFLKNKHEYIEKAKNTCLQKYGVESPIQSSDIKEKLNTTCLQKYGVLWNCMRKEAHNSRNYKSRPNEFFANILKENNIQFCREFNLNKYVYDFKVENTLIEINPSATHNINFNPFSKRKITDINYHKDKLLNAKNNGYNCIFVFDWDDPYKIIDILSVDKEKISARKCVVKEIRKKELELFLNLYHLQNSCKGNSVRLGLYYNDELIQVMSFGKPRYNKNYSYELIRLCTKSNIIVIGGAEKLFSYFIKTYNPETIISYCDISKFSGNIYLKLGFNKQQNSKPSCHWVNLKTKQIVNNNLLLKLGFDKLFNTNYGKNTSNTQLMLEHGFVQVYDCGQDVYIWKKQ